MQLLTHLKTHHDFVLSGAHQHSHQSQFLDQSLQIVATLQAVVQNPLGLSPRPVRITNSMLSVVLANVQTVLGF